MLEQIRAPVTADRLQPFAEPSVCIAELSTRDSAACAGRYRAQGAITVAAVAASQLPDPRARPDPVRLPVRRSPRTPRRPRLPGIPGYRRCQRVPGCPLRARPGGWRAPIRRCSRASRDPWSSTDGSFLALVSSTATGSVFYTSLLLKYRGLADRTLLPRSMSGRRMSQAMASSSGSWRPGAAGRPVLTGYPALYYNISCIKDCRRSHGSPPLRRGDGPVHPAGAGMKPG